MKLPCRDHGPLPRKGKAMLGPIEVDILLYCYEHPGTLKITEFAAITPFPSIARDSIRLLASHEYLEPLVNDETKITEEGIREVEQVLSRYPGRRTDS